MSTRLSRGPAARWPALAGSGLLHALVLALLLLRFAPELPRTTAPLAVELWAGGGSGRPAAEPSPEAVAAPAAPALPLAERTAPLSPPAVAVTTVLADAQVKLADKTAPKVKPVPPPDQVRQAQAKPAAEPPPLPAKAGAKAPVAARPAAPRAGSGDLADELLSGLGGPAGAGKGSVTQKGGKHGVTGGAANGQPGADAGYLDLVRGRIRPFVLVPASVSGNPQVELKVTLLPTLEVRSVVLVKSSGNAAYDAAVEAAVWQARRFPPLPPGARFTDYREYRLRFRPQD